MFDVLCLSDCCCDLIFWDLPQLPQPGGEVYGGGFALRAGGGANTPMGLARLGCSTAYAVTLGDDALGGLVRQALAEAGVAEDFLQVAPGGATWVSAVLSTREDRAFASFAGNSACYTREQLRQMVAACRRVHTYVYYCQRYPELPALCGELGVPLSMDLSDMPGLSLQALCPLLAQAELITPNQGEALALTGASTPQEALTLLRQAAPNVVVTMGASGCLAALDGGVYRATPPRVEFRDANGAGDLFNAGLLAARAAGLSPERQLARACASGAVSVSCVGGLDEHYTAAAVERLAQEVRVERMA